MNKKKLFPYFIFYVVTVLSSIVAVILYIKYFPIESKIITENINKTIVTEKGIEEAISNVYDAVVTVNSYYGDTKIGTGSGFIYKSDDKGYLLTNNQIRRHNRKELLYYVRSKLNDECKNNDKVLVIDFDKNR